MNTYFVTVTKDGSKKGESFSTFVKVENKEELQEALSISKSEKLMIVFTDASNYQDCKPISCYEFNDWLRGLKFHKTKLVFTDAITKVIKLPSTITYCKDNNTIEIVLNKEFSDYTTSDIFMENELRSWILSNFPHIKYYKSRAKFLLLDTDTTIQQTETTFVTYCYEYEETSHSLIEQKKCYEEEITEF